MTNADPAPSPSDARRLKTLAICVAVIGLTVVAFNLLYLFVPAGMHPPQGFAPGIRAAYARTIPMPSLVFSKGAFARVSILLQAGMWAAFFAAIHLLRKLADGPAERAAFKLIAFGSAAAAVALILTPPSLSEDIYHYALFGRMVITRGLNPYVTPGDALAGDPIWELATLRELPTHYGPAFTILSVLAAGAGSGGPIRTALAYKTLATVFGALTGWSVMSLARQQQRSGLVPLGLVAASPLLLIEIAGSGHNDLVMMGIALAGLVVAGRGKPDLGFAMLVCSAHVKWVTAALVGLVAIARLRDTVGLGARARQFAKMVAIAVGVTILLYLPFWTKGDMAHAARALVVGGASHGKLRLSQLLPFAAIVLSGIVVVARSGQRHLLEMAALACFGFVLFIFPWWMPWYMIPTLVLLAVGPFARLNATVFALAMVFALFLMANWAVLIPD